MASISDFLHKRHDPARVERTAFVLSGGAAMGALQVGMLRALLERRIRPDLVLGCSVGALNGVVVAADPSLAAVGRLQDVWMDVVARDLLPTGFLPSTMQLVRKGESIQSNAALRELIENVLPVATFAELSLPFQCVATNIDDAVEHWFHEGLLLDAVLASSSIPAVFPAVSVGGKRYLDGAIVNDVPVSRAVEMGATRIFVLQVGGIDRPRPEPRRPLDMAMLAFWIARRNRLLADLAQIPAGVEVIVLPHGNPPLVRYNDLSRSAQLMDSAYRATADHLDQRATGAVARTLGPLTARDLPLQTFDSDTDEEAELAAARQLVAAASAVDQAEAEIAAAGVEVELLTRTESIGPAMRALVDRVRHSGDRALARVRERRDSDDDPDEIVIDDVDPIVEPSPSKGGTADR